MANTLNFFRGEYSKYLELVDQNQIVATNLYFTIPDETPKDGDAKSSSYCVFHGTTLLASATHELDLKKVIGDVASLTERINNISSELAVYTISGVTVEDANVKEAYQLVKTVGENSEAIGEVIKVYKDSALNEVKLVTKNKKEFLQFSYTLADGSKSVVDLDVSTFLAQSEFKNGLVVSEDGEVSVKLGEDTTTNKNFLDFEGEVDGEKALAVRSIDTDSTLTTERILVAGGPLDSTALRGLLPKDESGNAYIEAGTDMQALLMSLFTKVTWPTPSVTEGQIDTTIEAPSFTLKNRTEDATNKTYEVGTVLTMSDVTLSEVSNSTTARTCSEFTYGYADTVDGEINTAKTVSIQASEITVNGDNYTMARDFTTFTNTDDSASASTAATAVTLSGVTCVVAEGECKVKVTVTGPKGECTFSAMPQYFVTSNVGTLSDEHKSPSAQTQTVKEDTTPSNNKEIKVNGRYKYFVGYSTKTSYDQFDSASIKGLNAQTGNLTVNSTTTVLNDTTKLKSNGTSIVVACPTKYKMDTITNGVGADILANFSSVGEVDYTNGSTTTKYKVYVYPITNGAEVEFKNLTIKKA